MSENQYFLLPGPTQIPPSILRAGAQPMINHRGPEFKQILTNVTENTKKIFETQNDLLVITSSGTGGLEAAVANFINRGDKIIVASIGNFGNRFADIAKQYGADVDLIEFPWGSPVNPQIIKDRLAADKNQEIKAILMQHNETSTGVYNPVKEVSIVRGNHPALLIVDSVSGMATAPLKTDEWGLDVVIAGSQKAFMAPPGLAFISVSKKAWEVQAKNTNVKYYFDLATAKEYYHKGQTPYTPAISIFYSVDAALKMMLDKGLDNIIEDHFFHRDIIRAGVKALGLSCVADDNCASPAVTAIYTPEGITSEQIVKPLLDKYHTVVAGGQGIFKDNTFRIGHLGYVNDLDLLSCLAAVEMTLLELGYQIELGKGVAAGQKLIMQKYQASK
ncbi:MAG: pyridoxal-phosphate-dependent aminotransferase family protein [Bacillota bacterium]|jgi:aspartate aminotransferase-like enzyme